MHESTARAPPKYAFRPKDPHFEIDPHDFPGIYIHIYTSNIRNLDSFRLFSPRFDSRVPDRLIELGRREMLRGNFSNRAAIERGKHATPTTRRKISIPSLPCFLPPLPCVFLREFYFYLYSFSTFSNCIYIEISFPISIFFFFFFLDREPLFDSFRNRGMDKRKKGKKALEKSGDYVSCTKKGKRKEKKGGSMKIMDKKPKAFGRERKGNYAPHVVVLLHEILFLDVVHVLNLCMLVFFYIYLEMCMRVD